MKYKIIFFDVDGTITSHTDGTVHESTKDAIHKLLEKGVKVVAATGRPLSMCGELQELGIDTFITANGGYVKHQNHVIYKNVLNPLIVQEVMNYAATEKNALTFYSEKLQMNDIQHPVILQALNETLSLTNYPETNLLAHKEEIYLMCLFADEEVVEKYTTRFPQLTFKRWHPYILNVLDNEVSKSRAIVEVLNYFGIDKREAVAFGDGENDIDMLELVDVGIAMGNGGDKLKSIANFVTKPSDKDGIAFALKKYALI